MGIPDQMLAAVYHGRNDVRMEQVPVPEIEHGEVLVRVGACGVCSTDIKKVELGLLPPPRIFGHETVGTIVQVGDGVTEWDEGDRVGIYHHIPDRTSWYSQRNLYAQCPQYKRVGVTAGFEPAGGGFAEYVRVMPWIVEGEGLVAIPDDVEFDEATFIEPVNTCLKGIRSIGLDEEHVVLVAGVGSIGLILMQLAIREGASVIAADPLPGRLDVADELGAVRTVDPTEEDVHEVCRELTEGRGADRAIVAAVGDGPVRDAIRATRPGATILLFAQTHRGDEVAVDVGDLCLDEKRVVGSYSASVDEADEAAEIVFSGDIEVDRLITHRVPLAEAPAALELASSPSDEAIKVVVVHEDEA
ncbi:MAG: alcohol dehydrogenase catalytic domain-containing protein [Planctomycetota bacterium]|jgi:L-iditol 2-dehydrogenase